MLFALGWASGSGLVPVSVGLLWHPQLQRPVVGLRLVRTPGAVAGLGAGGEGHICQISLAGVQDRFPVVAGPWVLSGDETQVV